MALDTTSPTEALTEASALFAGLITGVPNLPTFPASPTINIPTLAALPEDLNLDVTLATVGELTEGAVAGTGVFDKIMSSLNAHIESQYLKGIIGKSEVASVYIAAIQSTLPQAVNYLLQGQQSYWAAKLVQIQAQNAWLERARLIGDLEVLKLTAYRAQADAYIAQVGALTAQTQFANGKLNLVAVLQDINNKETAEAVSQAQYDAAYVQTHNTLPNGGVVGGAAAKDLLFKDAQIATAAQQTVFLQEQTNVQHAQTHDTNLDATPLAGILGTQKALYTQQIDSYVQDGKSKGVKMLADLWTSAKALDDAVQSPGPIAGNLMMAMNTYLNGLNLPNAMVSPDAPASGAPSTDANWNVPGDQ